ncbi:MAG: hypothetical protein ACRDQ4_03285 [Pseudonocardiaceae bacterium]
MSAAEPPPAEPPNRFALRAVTPKGRATVVVTKLADGRIEFALHGGGAWVFAVEEDELIKVLVRWV